MSQMSNVSCRYGAPMGRGRGIFNIPAGKIRLFRVKINSGGYDDGGAYWGLGSPLFCATDDMGYCEYTRAMDRGAAALKLHLDNSNLKRKISDL